VTPVDVAGVIVGVEVVVVPACTVVALSDWKSPRGLFFFLGASA